MSDLLTFELSPSEIVLVHGEQFAPKHIISNFELPIGDQKVGAHNFAVAALRAAILAAEATGAIRLQMEKKKALLGLRSVESLRVYPCEDRPFPVGSFEADIFEHAEGNVKSGRNDVSELVVDLLQEDSSSATHQTRDMILGGLSKRGYFEQVVERKLLLFEVAELKPRPALLEAAAKADVSGVKALLERCQRERPDVWKELEDEIKNALGRRTEAPDTDDWPDSD